MKNLDWVEIKNRLESFATSDSAKGLLRDLKPYEEAQHAQQRMADIECALDLIRSGVRPHMESLDVFHIWWERIRRNAILKTLELRDVRRFCHETLALKAAIEELQSPGFWLQTICDALMDAEKPLSAIDQLMTPLGEIRTDASQTLFHLYQEKLQTTRQIQSLLDKLVKSFDLESVLQDRFVTTREGRWVLPVRSGAQHQFAGVIHGASHSKQTVFMEPEQVVPLNNRMSQLEAQIEQEIERLLIQISTYLTSLTTDFQHSQKLLLEADEVFAQAQLSHALGANRCSFFDNQIRLLDLRHPLLVLSDRPVVPNTVELDPTNRILLLSGPNAGGKTVLLKSVGLAAQMARCGLPICAAPGSSLPFFKNIDAAVGDSQSVDTHLSTFAAHVTTLNEALNHTGTNTLLLFDEICGSTDPEEGCALARSFIEAYAHNSVFAVITSHLGPLKQGWAADSGVINGSMEYDAKHDRPLYQFLLGVPGDSLALQTAHRVGVNEAVLKRAYEALSPETRRLHSQLQETEVLKKQLGRLQDELKQKIRDAETQAQLHRKHIAEFEHDKAARMESVLKEAEQKVIEIIEQARVQQIFKKHDVMSQVRAHLPEVVKATSNKHNAINSAEDFARHFPAGSVVFVPSLNQDGIIQGAPNSKGEVPVLSQSLRLILPWQDLHSARKPQNPTAQLLRKSNITVSLTNDQELSVDVRGFRVDEAISKLEIALDQAALKGQERVKIVHGHGTEALKKSIRSHLSRSPYVRLWQAGSDDGVTWVELN